MTSQYLEIQPTKNWIVMGGGILLVWLVNHLQKKGYTPIIACGKRHLEEEVTEHKTLAEHLTSLNIDYITSSNINTEQSFLEKIQPDTVAISLDSPWIFKKAFIEKFSGKLINSHGARLPQDRGGATVSWRIMRGERMGYCVLHQVDPGIDTGNIVAIKEFQYPVSCRVPNDYLEFAIQQDFIFLQDFITKVENGSQFTLLSQPEYLSTYWPRLHTKTHGYINWSWKLHHIESFICAFDMPYPGASTFLQNRKVRLRKVAASVSDGVFHPFQSGLIYRKSSEFLYVATEYGTIIVGEVIDDETEANITQKITVGERFYTPTAYLSDALQYRAIYTAQGLKT